MRIAFTTTATNRPEIVEKTYSSFNSNLNGYLKKCELIINIDPLPSGDNREEVVKVAEKHFKKVTAITPATPNFTTAINTLWSEAKTDYIFHLEDDWVLTQSFSVDSIIDYLDKNPKYLQCVLRAYNYDYNKMALSPSIIKKKLYSQIAGKLNANLNPEIQLRDTNVTKYDLSKGYVTVFGEKPIVKDIGREWMEKSAFRRPDKKAHFNSWVKK